MEAQPLSKKIHDKAKQLGIDVIVLNFSGGSDEGYLYVNTAPKSDSDFNQEIEDWAWNVYDYSGGGDGNDYGDDITYNLKEGKVYSQEWYHAPSYTDLPTTDLKLEDE